MPSKKVPQKAKPSKVSVKNSSIRDFWENLSWMTLADFFNDRTIKRGRDYAENGNVESIWATDDGKSILAVVIGTEEYYTHVSLSEEGNEACGVEIGSDFPVPSAVTASMVSRRLRSILSCWRKTKRLPGVFQKAK